MSSSYGGNHISQVSGSLTFKIEKTRLSFLNQFHIGLELEETMFWRFHLSGPSIPDVIDSIRIITDHIDSRAS